MWQKQHMLLLILYFMVLQKGSCIIFFFARYDPIVHEALGGMNVEAEQKGQGKQKLILGLLVALLAIGGAGGGWWWYMNTKYVSTDDARIAGTIVSVSAKIPGKVTEVLVKEGDQVKAGQVIARIDAREAGAQKLQAQAAPAPYQVWRGIGPVH